MRLEDLIQRIEQIIQDADRVIQTQRGSVAYKHVDNELFQAFRSKSLSFLVIAFGKEHTHYSEFNSNVTQPSLHAATAGRGILSAAREDLTGGWLTTTRGLISAEIFSDFLEMAEYLLEEGYKDPAAVMSGSVLEEHLRQLCQQHGISTTVTKQGSPRPRKADALNADLGNKGVYNKLDQKNVTAWLDLRNKAAHGKYQEYTREQVSLMLQSVSDFMVRVTH